MPHQFPRVACSLRALHVDEKYNNGLIGLSVVIHFPKLVIIKLNLYNVRSMILLILSFGDVATYRFRQPKTEEKESIFLKSSKILLQKKHRVGH